MATSVQFIIIDITPSYTEDVLTLRIVGGTQMTKITQIAGHGFNVNDIVEVTNSQNRPTIRRVG